MAAPSRSAQFTKLHKTLKKHFTPVAPDPNRSVLEHLLFASCLENAHFQVAEEGFAALVHTFFDWNEIRVSSIRELSEVMAGLPDAAAAANRVKRVLQSVFESSYSFDLEELRKQNLGPAVERIQKIDGTSKFSVAYVTQAALGGHSIPLDAGTLQVLRLLDVITDEEAAAGTIAGLERAIPKNAGVEFGSLLHQLGAEYTANPYRPEFHKLLQEIEPGVKDRLPSRRAPKPEPVSPPAASKPAKKPSKEEAKDSGKDSSKDGGKDGAKASKETAKHAKEEAASPSAKSQIKEAHKGKESHKEKEPAKEHAKEQSKEAAGEAKGKHAAGKKKAEEESPPIKASHETAPRKKEHAAEDKDADRKKTAKKKAEAKGAGDAPSAAEGLAKRKPR